MNPIQALYLKIETSKLLQCIRSGLVMIFPFLLIGSVATVLNSLPIQAYQLFIHQFFDGILSQIFVTVHSATFGLISLYIVATTSISYANQYMQIKNLNYGALLTSYICFAIFSGFGTDAFTIETFSARGMFLAIICSLFASKLYTQIFLSSKRKLKLFTDGADPEFTTALDIVMPIFLCTAIFALLDIFMLLIFKTNNIYILITSLVNHFFINIESTFFSGIVFLFFVNFLWFFGIHGGDSLENVSLDLFAPAVEINANLVANGLPPTEIISKTFLDTFVLIGGSGTTICLLLAILLFHKKKSSYSLAKMATIPMVFNMNEMVVFGLPIVMNPAMFLPFLCVPIVLMLTSYFAMYIGLVPYATNTVAWTTPVFLSGYIATGSISGSILQLVNIVIGILIYQPFLTKFEAQKLENSKSEMLTLLKILQESEKTGKNVSLITSSSKSGIIARILANDLKHMIEATGPDIKYQPQYNDRNICVGVEALFRWNHPIYGNIYPPLAIKIAEESDFLETFEGAIFAKVASDAGTIMDTLGEDVKISINISPQTINPANLYHFTRFFKHNKIPAKNICIEVTEQVTLHLSNEIIDVMTTLKSVGYCFALDDFAMGSTSIKYLQENLFDFVKIDGSLIKDMMVNERSEKIVSSLISLANELGFEIVAEFVENQAYQEKLLSLGCRIYQGYYYSPAVDITKLDQFSKP